MDEYRVVFITTPNEATSLSIARTLVNERLAACVNILPQVRSIYQWKEDMCDEMEQMLVIKTISKNVKRLVARVKTLHGYEVPEVIALPILTGNKDYLSWISHETDTEEG